MAEIREYLDLQEFQERGYLQEANRLFFHPLGLALEISQGDDGSWTLSGIWDCRETSVVFADSPSAIKAATVALEKSAQIPLRSIVTGTADGVQLAEG